MPNINLLSSTAPMSAQIMSIVLNILCLLGLIAYIYLLIKNYKFGYKRQVAISAVGAISIPVISMVLLFLDKPPAAGQWFGSLFGVSLIILLYGLPLWIIGWIIVLLINVRGMNKE